MLTELAADYIRLAKSHYGDGPTGEYHRVLPTVEQLSELDGRTMA